MGANLSPTLHESIHSVQDEQNSLHVPVEHRHDRLIIDKIDLGKAYVQGRAGLLVCVEPILKGVNERSPVIPDERASQMHAAEAVPGFPSSVRAYSYAITQRCNSEDRGEQLVFVPDIQAVQTAQDFTR